MPALHLEADGARGRRASRGASPAAGERAGARGELLCAACGRRITHDDHRIAVAGAHEHTFVNPGGFVYVVACFAFATGLSYVGATETAFSWFPGHAWQIAACGRCGTHLGWIYRSAGEQFHGLLPARLVPGGADEPPG